MKKQPFTSNGLEQLLDELYALPPSQLQQQSEALRSAPKTWIQDHFELDNNQQLFLDQMQAQTSRFLGDQGSFAIGNQLPIILSKQGNEKDPDGKLFFPKSSLTISNSAGGSIKAGGYLEIQIIYP